MQNQFIENYTDVPFSGNFISFRGSMVNWCMIGRDASHEMRDAFIDIDKDVRKKLQEQLDDQLGGAKLHNIVTSLGGSTSIDIYPKGWDKTYCLRHIEDQRKIYFVGDRCQPSGNDYALYIHKNVAGYETKNPANTLEILEEIKKDIVSG